MTLKRYEYGIVPHNPPESYGDCFRACVASVLGYSVQEVPHFFEGGNSPELAIDILREFVSMESLIPVSIAFPGEFPLNAVLSHWHVVNPDVAGILFGTTETGAHCVVIQNGKIEHNPSVANNRIIGPAASGYWSVMVFAVK